MAGLFGAASTTAPPPARSTLARREAPDVPHRQNGPKKPGPAARRGRPALNSLPNIEAFVRCVELGGFSAAGRSLRLSAAVVSHRIQVLERHLGCRLFNRTTRKVQLTEQGRVFYERCLEIKEAVERAESSVTDAGAAPRGTLRVTAPLGFGRRVVAPLVPRYRAMRPEIDVRLRLSDYLVDLLVEAVDVAVRMAPLADSSLVARRVAELPRALVAAPDYLARHGSPRRVEDLAGHQCLMLRFPGSGQFRWTLMDGDEPVVVAPWGPMDADDGDVLTDWALAGGGIALKPLFEVAAHLRSGALVRVLPEHPPQPVSLALLYPHRPPLPVKVRTFADLLVEEARSHIAAQTAGLAP